MRIARFRHNRRTRLGVLLDDDTVLDVGGVNNDLPSAIDDLLARDPDGLSVFARAKKHCDLIRPLRDVQLLAPVRRPSKFLAVGLNYRAHAEETGRPLPEWPVLFNKQTSSIHAPFGEILHPSVTSALDYEGELAFVIGRRCRNVTRSDAARVIAGYLVANDVSMRDWQARSPTMTQGKSYDTHGPLGPWLVTTDEVQAPNELAIRTFVNDELRQDAPTADMIFDCFALVECISRVMTLEAGDVITTGTPAGVGAGHTPPAWLRPGDRVRIEIQNIGAIEHVIAEEGVQAPE